MTSLNDLDVLASSIPMLNEKAVAQNQAANAIQAKRAAASAAPGVSNVAVGQTLAPALTAENAKAQAAGMQATAQSAITGAQQQAQALAASGELALGQQQLAAEAGISAANRTATSTLAAAEQKTNADLAAQDIARSKRMTDLGITTDATVLSSQLDVQKQLADLGGNLEDELFTKRQQFDADEQGRKFSNFRQLADWTLASAASANEAAARLQVLQQDAATKRALMEAVYAKLSQTLEDSTLLSEAHLDQAQQVELAGLVAQNKREQGRASSEANTNAEIVQGITTAATIAAMIVLSQ